MRISSIAVLLGFVLSAVSAAADSSQISIKGSDTMVHLVSSWAEDYMAGHKDVEIAVTGGGSGTGIVALINKTTDICSASREMKKEEKEQAVAKGVQPIEHVVANDGLAIIVHPSNPISTLTMDQLAKIYTGQVTNWKDLGGKDEKILALSRESSSGTYVFFQEHVMGKKDYAPAVRLMPATSSIVQGVTSDVGAVGYVGLGYASEAGSKVKIVSVKKDESSPAVLPSEATVLNRTYSVARPLFLYTPGEAKGAVKSFIDFALSSQGQAVVKEAGYVGVHG